MKKNLKFTLLVIVAPAVVLAATTWIIFSGGAPAAGPTTQLTPQLQNTTPSTTRQYDSLRAGQSSADSGLQGALNETDPDRRARLLEQWAASVSVEAMADTLNGTDSISNDALKSEVRAALLSSWTKRDPGSMASWFSNRGGADGLYQQSRDQLAQAMSQQDPATMLDWMEKSMPESTRKELYIPICRQWMSTDPVGTAGVLRKIIAQSANHPTSSDSAWIELAGQVAAQWVDSDMNSAITWAKSLPQGAARDRALAQVSDKWTEANPQTAAAYAAQENNPQLLKIVAAKWAQTDPQSAATWARGLTSSEASSAAIISLLPMWTQKDPQAAASYAASLPPGETQNQAAVSVVSAWAYSAPDQAAIWVAQFPEGAARIQAMKQLVNTWTTSDADQVGQWLQSLPQTPSRDSAVVAYINARELTSPDTAFQWAQAITDKSLREQQLQAVARVWLKNDAAAAKQQITKSSFPQDLKDQLLSMSVQ